jgi:hypothetical protein
VILLSEGFWKLVWLSCVSKSIRQLLGEIFHVGWNDEYLVDSFSETPRILGGSQQSISPLASAGDPVDFMEV